MCSVLKIIGNKSKSEKGFVLIVALLAILIMMAVGFYALTTSSQDIRIASRLIGERKAFSAAEAGVHVLCKSFNPTSAASFSGQVDPDNDPSIRYSTTLPVRNGTMPSIDLPGFDMSKAYVGSVFDTLVTGVDSNYGSSVTIAVGTAYAPNPSDTQQGGG